jgi:hypothetical protein
MNKTRLKSSSIFLVFLIIFSLFPAFQAVSKVQAGTTIIKHSITVTWDFDNNTLQGWGGSDVTVSSSQHQGGGYSIYSSNAHQSGATASQAFAYGYFKDYALCYYFPVRNYSFPANVLSANISFYHKPTYGYDANTLAEGIKIGLWNGTYGTILYEHLNTGLSTSQSWVLSEIFNITPSTVSNRSVGLRVGVVAYDSVTGWNTGQALWYDTVVLKYDYNEIIVTSSALIGNVQNLIPIFIGIGIAGFVIIMTRRRQA